MSDIWKKETQKKRNWASTIITDYFADLFDTFDSIPIYFIVERILTMIRFHSIWSDLERSDDSDLERSDDIPFDSIDVHLICSLIWS